MLPIIENMVNLKNTAVSRKQIYTNLIHYSFAGSNCWLKDRIIWGGQWVMEKVSSSCSMTCICPGFDAYAKTGVKTQAKCTNPCH